ncbi:MAG: beta-glucosidase [Anaerolineae bacterium]|nr:beta-glucosidase [Anaerolineae bacterium]
MATKTTFPDGFLWGTATASFQIEGGIEERGRCIWDDFCRWPGKVFEGHTGDVADDHYHRFPEDVALMADLGLGAYRFSISWPRILPEGVGETNPQGLDFYDRLVDALLERHIVPYVTLYHWDLPSALQRVGGWAARDTAYRFADYVAIVADRLGDRVRDWITHNEPWVVAFVGNLDGRHAPGWEDLGQALQIGHHLLVSHGLSVPILRERGDDRTRVGITLNYSPAYPASQSSEDLAATQRHDGYHNRWFMDPLYKGHYPEDLWRYFDYNVPRVAPGDLELIRRPIDFLGINYYTRAVVQAQRDAFLERTTLHPEGEYTAMDWEVYPQGLTDLLVRLARDYGAPDMYITENGCAYEDELTADGQVHDVKRVAYLKAHFAAVQQAIAQGVPLKGYFVWSLLDNFEWALGYSRRFGVVYVDYGTQRRYLKDSAKYLASVAQENALTG